MSGARVYPWDSKSRAPATHKLVRALRIGTHAPTRRRAAFQSTVGGPGHDLLRVLHHLRGPGEHLGGWPVYRQGDAPLADRARRHVLRVLVRLRGAADPRRLPGG